MAVFSNHVRLYVLALSVLAVLTLSCNVFLLNFILVSRNDLIPKHFRAPEGLGRFPRSVEDNSTLDGLGDIDPTQGMPVVGDDFDPMPENTSVFIAQLVSASPETQGSPMSSVEIERDRFTYPPTIKNTRRILLTKAGVEATTQPTVPDDSGAQTEKTLLTPPKDKDAADTGVAKSEASVDLKPAGVEDSETADSVQSVSLFSLNRPWQDDFIDFFFYAAPGVGILLGYLPMSWALRAFKSHKIILGVLVLSAVLTSITPFIEETPVCLIVVRVLQGITLAPVFVFIGQNAVEWAALKEQLCFVTISFLGLLAAPYVSWNVAALIGDPVLVFAVHSIATFVVALLWLVFYRNSPQQHRWIYGIELNRIVCGKAQNNRLMQRDWWRTLFKSITVSILWAAALVYFSGFLLLAIFGPTYANQVLRLTPSEVLSLTAPPFAVLVVTHVLATWLESVLNCGSLTLRVRVWNTLGFVLAGLLFVGCAVCNALFEDNVLSNANYAVHVLALAPLGLASVGWIKSAILVGRFYTQFIIAHLSILLGLAWVAVCALVVLVTPVNSLLYWRLPFLVVGLALIIGAVIFAIFGRGQASRWAEDSWDPSSSHHMLKASGEFGVVEMRHVLQ